MKWGQSLPLVTVPRAAEPKRVTLVVPYYQNARFLQRQLAHWRDCFAQCGPWFSVIVVDDGSPDPAVIAEPGVRLFRIEVDRRWNWLAARNIGAHQAKDGWLLLTDMDHLVPLATVEAAIFGAHRPDTIYAFARREHTGQAVHPHSASFLLTKALFWEIGGYDEALSGLYGSDGEFRRRAATFAPFVRLPDELIRYEFVDDASTTRYQRKQPEDARLQQLVAARGANWRPTVLSFDYREIAC